MLSDNGSPYIASETQIFARQLGLKPCFNPAYLFNNIFADFIDHTPGQLATTVAIREGDGYRLDVSNLLRLIDLHT